MWRAEDEALLERLEDDALFEELLRARLEGRAPEPAFHPRAAGLVHSARGLPGFADVRAGADLAGLLDRAPMPGWPPALLHHFALFEARVAAALADVAPEHSASARVRSFAALLALAHEGRYLEALARAVLAGVEGGRATAASWGDVGGRLLAEAIGEARADAERGARALDRPGRAALLALSWFSRAAEQSGAPERASEGPRAQAESACVAALESALSPIEAALEEARVAGRLGKDGQAPMLRALHTWEWAGRPEHVEQFIVTKLADIGWELYRGEDWAELRRALDPHRVVFDHLAARIERDPSRVAYAAPCAQMFVFVADVEVDLPRRIAAAERAVRVCPTHRNGRLTLAALLLDDACRRLSDMRLVARRDEVERLERQIRRAEALYPRSREIGRAKELLERARAAPLSI